MTRPRFSIAPQIRRYSCRHCDREITYRPGKQPPPGALYRLCPACNHADIVNPRRDADVLTDPDADVRSWRSPPTLFDDLLDQPTYTPDLDLE